MAGLYRMATGTSWGPLRYSRLEIGLVDYLGSDFGRSAEGLTILRKGTPEWLEHIENQRRLLQSNKDYPSTPERIRSFIEDLSGPDFINGVSRDFWGLSYERSNVQRRLLSDRDARNVVCDLSYRDKRIDVFRGGAGATNLIGDQFLKTREQAYYDGTLFDAVREFRDAGFKLTLWDTSLRTDTNKLTPIEDASMDDIAKYLKK